MEVSKERNGFRDEWISRRHRAWGWDCPAVDVDFLMCEYNLGLPAALVEYKHHAGYPTRHIDARHPSIRAVVALANASRIPALVTFYFPEHAAFQVQPLNEHASSIYPDNRILTEYAYVGGLYKMRSRTVAAEVGVNLSRTLPEFL